MPNEPTANPGAAAVGAEQNQTPNPDPNPGAQQTPQQETKQPEAKTYTQEEVDKLLQVTGDKRATTAGAKAIETFKKTELPKLLTEAITEAKRLEQMTAEERVETERQKAAAELKAREEALAEREREANRHELKAAVIDTLTEKGLPVSLWKVVNYENADTCNESIKALETEWRKAVEDGVNARLKTSVPKKPPEGVEDPFLAGLNKK